MSRAIDTIMTFIYDQLEGSGLNFALVVWKPGIETGSDSIGFAIHPPRDTDAAKALALAAVKAEEIHRAPRPEAS